MTAEQSLRAAEFTARHWHQAALGSGHIPFAHAIACISAAIAGETDPNQLGLDPSVHDAFRAALGEPDGATPHREPETDANGWTLKDDGIWTLPVDGGTVLMTRQTTPEERARFAEQWARDTKTKPGDDWAQKDDGTWKLTVKVGHHHSAAFRADESSTPWYRAQFARIAKAVSPILEEWPEHNRIDEHEHVTNAITEAVLAVLTPKEGRQ